MEAWLSTIHSITHDVFPLANASVSVGSRATKYYDLSMRVTGARTMLQTGSKTC